MANKNSLSQAVDQRDLAPSCDAASSHDNPDRAPAQLQQQRQLELQMREALVLWLRWNTAYEQASERLFEAGQSPEKIEDLMDWLDQLRREAIQASRDLLDG
jgi:hypothetical protein